MRQVGRGAEGSILGRGKSTCEGPEASKSLTYLGAEKPSEKGKDFQEKATC